MKEKSFVSVVFYLRNYEKYIDKFIETIVDHFDEEFENFELICVNNDSTDNSIKKLKQAYERNGYSVPMNIINMSYCRSREEAMAAGIDLAIGDFIYSFESILIDYQINEIMNVYHESLKGNDVVFVCSSRKLSMKQKMYYSLYNFGVKKGKEIYPERFKLFTRRAINRVENISDYLPSNMPSLKASGLQTETVFFNPSKTLIKYDKEEYSERLTKAFESIILYTTSIPLLFCYFGVFSLIISIIMFLLNMFYVGLFMLLILFLSVICAVITYYIHVQLNIYLKNNTHLIKSIEKVVKQ